MIVKKLVFQSTHSSQVVLEVFARDEKSSLASIGENIVMLSYKSFERHITWSTGCLCLVTVLESKGQTVF